MRCRFGISYSATRRSKSVLPASAASIALQFLYSAHLISASASRTNSAPILSPVGTVTPCLVWEGMEEDFIGITKCFGTCLQKGYACWRIPELISAFRGAVRPDFPSGKKTVLAAGIKSTKSGQVRRDNSEFQLISQSVPSDRELVCPLTFYLFPNDNVARWLSVMPSLNAAPRN